MRVASQQTGILAAEHISLARHIHVVVYGSGCVVEKNVASACLVFCGSAICLVRGWARMHETRRRGRNQGGYVVA